MIATFRGSNAWRFALLCMLVACGDNGGGMHVPGGFGGIAGGGTGGTSGSGGAAGSAGTAGTAGTGGEAGSGGIAGSAGTGGIAGSAGTGGIAGSAGTGGIAGSAGTGGIAGTDFPWDPPPPPVRETPDCAGAVSSCSSRGSSTCTLLDGCSLDGDCSGLSYSCFSQSSHYLCITVQGCVWNSSNNRCSGSAWSCSSYSGRSTCTGQPGCRWNETCGGSATPCSLLGSLSCESQTGCYLDCDFGTEMCGTQCVDVLDDEQHCGNCNHDCGYRGTCTSGECECGAPGMLCGGRCLDVLTDNANCGSCGHACGSGYACLSGACQDVDECVLGTCFDGRVCTNTPGSYTCGPCSAGYEESGNGCTDENECLTNHGGCASNATCTNSPGAYSCACNSGYAGNGITCSDVDECASNNGGCHQLTTCANTVGGRTCSTCPSGYVGNGATGCADINECADNNGGCAPGTTCTNNIGSAPTCGGCPNGYSGSGSTGCTDINECTNGSASCPTNATCANAAGTYNCPCNAGYMASGNACVDVNECANNNGGCSLNAACGNSSGGRTCTCNAGYSGDGITCADLDECAAQVDDCHANATCGNTSGSFVCTCNSGYAGNGRSCADVNECSMNNGGCDLAPLATCNNTVGSFTCSCPTGTTGDGYTCSDINECVVGNPCSPHADCTNLLGSFSCACRTGYTGNGITCSDADECTVNNGGCDPLTTCTNNPGEDPSCGVCPSGYAGTGLGGCRPALTSLTTSFGFLSPALNTTRFNYLINVDVVTNTVTLTPTTTPGSTITINGSAVISGAPWQSPTLALGDTTVSIVVSRTGHASSTYSIVLTRGHYGQAFIKASNPGALDQFGTSVALWGDTLVVGAPYEDSAATGVNGAQNDESAMEAGAAYVFVRNAGLWTQQAYLKASNTGAGDNFGTGVAIHGNTILVSALNERSSATGVNGNQGNNSMSAAGAVYVFVRNGNTWSQQAYLKASNTGANDGFGGAMAIYDNTAVVGARYEGSAATGINGDQSDNSATRSGAAYVFVRSGTTWSQEAYVKASNTEASDNFGTSLSLSGNTLVVGAPLEDSAAVGINGDQSSNAGGGAGAAYVFVRSGSTWSQEAYVKASNAESGDNFGSAVAVDGNVMLVGAPEEDSAATGLNGNQMSNTNIRNGAAYLFTRSGSTWSQQTYVKPTVGSGGATFGHAVALSQGFAAIGHGQDRRITVYQQSGNTWALVAVHFITFLPAGNIYDMGRAFAVSGETIASGAPSDHSSAAGINGDALNMDLQYSGAAQIYR